MEFKSFPKESTLFPKKGALPQGKFISPKKSCFFHIKLFLIPWGTCLGLALSFFLLREVTS